MKRLLAIGEALIDFIPQQVGCSLAQVEQFHPATGGAPGNVCAAYAKLGGQSALITQLGQDAFGDKITQDLAGFGVDTRYVYRTAQANTSLAFVSLQADGNREFAFFRKPAADMLLTPEQIDREWFTDCGLLHFCSVSLGEYPMRIAHERAITYATEAGALISFDPNVRLPLWDDHTLLRARILEFMPKAHVLKISDEELAFITGKEDIHAALPKLFKGQVQLVIYTQGAQGACAFTRYAQATVPGEAVQAIDTTGAGDAFIGSLLYQLAQENIGVEQLQSITAQQLVRWLKASNQYCAKSVQRTGGPESYDTTM